MKKFPKVFLGILKMDIQNVQKRKAKNTFGKKSSKIGKFGVFSAFFSVGGNKNSGSAVCAFA
jgi:hypothetical protein